MAKFNRMGQPEERQLAPGKVPTDIDRGKPERVRLNKIKSPAELAKEIENKAIRKAEKLRLRRLAGKA